MTGARARFGFLVGVIVALLCAGLVGVWAVNRPATDAPSELARAGIPVSAADTTLDDPKLDEEREEQGEGVERAGRGVRAGQGAGHGRAEREAHLCEGRRGAAAAPGGTWVGEVPIDTTADDWEPAIAADPSAPWVYVLTTRYGRPSRARATARRRGSPCRSRTDGGATFPTTKPLCACKGSGQFDPIIEVVPGTGAVYSLYMNGFNVLFTKSTDHGATWSAPVKTYGSVSWNDKPIIAVSDNGQDVYAAFNGPTGGDPWLAQSHDAGLDVDAGQARRLEPLRLRLRRRRRARRDRLLRRIEPALRRWREQGHDARPARSRSTSSSRATTGATWIDKVVGQTQPGLACTAAGCTPDFYLGHHAVTADANGNLVFLYDGATTAGGKQSIYAPRSTDHGATLVDAGRRLRGRRGSDRCR